MLWRVVRRLKFKMANYIYKDGELCHYGVPGMRWGVRKTRRWATSEQQPSSKKSSFLAGVYAATGSKKVGKALDKSNSKDAENWKRAKEAYAKTQKSNTPKKKKISELSDNELQAKIDRLNLEKKYKELSTTVNPPKSTRGRDFTLRVLEKIGENVLTDIGTQAGATVLGELINKSAGVKSDDAANRIVNPRKNQTNKK